MMTKRGGTPGLFEFLEEADLPQYYHGLRNVLRVYQVHQLKYVIDEDLYSIGMSRPEARRLKVCFQKYNPQTYTSKLKRLLLPNTWSKDEFLLDDVNEVDLSPSPNNIQHNSGIKVPRQHIISPEAIKICKELGAGEFGVVEQGVLTDGNRSHQVAIKSLCKERMSNSMFEFMKEYEIMQSIEHQNVVELFGVVLETSRIMLITELAPLRSLLECLKEPSLRPTLNIVCLANFGQQICEGMKYLESKRLIHRDLAARNILVFSKNLVKVSDFGLSRALGVGKDYYQTNFNANLKLPIAWCAPECITFLKFTSASDVWAFGVTLWEMFSYGFQPWAAHTGQQILEAIDEPNCQRLEQPLHCPTEHYLIMQQCWRQDPNSRPTFAQMVSILEDAGPEQVQAVQPYSQKLGCGTDRALNMLDFEVGTVITVLDKNNSSPVNMSTVLWTGVRDDNGNVGHFSPNMTVAYVNTLPSNSENRKWQQGSNAGDGSASDTLTSVFQRGSSRSLSRSGRKKLSRDMISAPRGQVQHTGHVGIDGIHFGNVAGFFDFKSTSYASMPCLVAGQSMSLGPVNDSSSELAPLLKSNKNSSAGGTNKRSNTFEGNNSKSSRNPRLGYTIGYLRNKGNGGSNAILASSSGKDSVGQNEKTKHEYQSISDKEEEEDEDDFFLTPPDLGPSLVDEVLSELGGVGESDDKRNDSNLEPEETKKGSDFKDLKDLVSSLTISRKPKHKKLATVKPIKASDERTLENAIAMANALASKSMHELDKRTTDHFYDSSPGPSPLTPNSPTKRFSFWFPTPGGHHSSNHHQRSSSPRCERKPFSDEVNTNVDLESTLSVDEKNAYKALIDGIGGKTLDNDFDFQSDFYGIDDPKKSLGLATDNDNSSFYAGDVTPTNNNHLGAHAISNGNSNPLPLPPKTVSLTQTNSKRHVRKNPLILPSSRVANLISRSETAQEQPVFNLQAPPLKRNQMSKRREASAGRDEVSSNQYDNVSNRRDISQNREVTTCVVAPISRASSDRRQTYHFDDAFEDALESQIDALDNIAEDNFKETNMDDIRDVVHAPHLDDSNMLLPPLPEGMNKEIDEVRIIRKVIGLPVDRSVCLSALSLSRWDIHLAIKIIRLVNMVYEEQGIRLELNQESTISILRENDWDVDKAANAILHRDQCYF